MNFSKYTDEERCQFALGFVQESQDRMALACQALCSVECKSSFTTVKMHDQIKKHWHRLNSEMQSRRSHTLMAVLDGEVQS